MKKVLFVLFLLVIVSTSEASQNLNCSLSYPCNVVAGQRYTGLWYDGFVDVELEFSKDEAFECWGEAIADILVVGWSDKYNEYRLSRNVYEFIWQGDVTGYPEIRLVQKPPPNFPIEDFIPLDFIVSIKGNIIRLIESSVPILTLDD